MAASDFITLPSGQLHYYKWGSGKQLVIAFHGYGNNGLIWKPLAAQLSEKFTFVSIELPHHGLSKNWYDEQTLGTADVVELVHYFLSLVKAKDCVLLGFSLGGRVALSILQAAPNLVKKIVLIAPDGLAFNPAYYFFTTNTIGKSIFSTFTTKPKPWLRIANILQLFKVISPSRFRFISSHVGSDNAKELLKKAWPSLRELVPTQKSLKAIIIRNKIPVDIVMGRYDTVIPLKLAEDFALGNPFAKVLIMEKGHRIMDLETFSLVKSLLQKTNLGT